MILTSEKIKVTDSMLLENNMTRGEQFGVPVDPKNPSLGLRWKYISQLDNKDFDALEEYFLLKARTP